MDGQHIAFVILLILWMGSMIIILILATKLKFRNDDIEWLKRTIANRDEGMSNLEKMLRQWTDRCHQRDKRINELVELAHKKY